MLLAGIVVVSESVVTDLYIFSDTGVDVAAFGVSLQRADFVWSWLNQFFWDFCCVGACLC